MGEYADDEYRRSIKARFGFDPGSMYGDDDKPARSTRQKQRTPCPRCGKRLFGVADHLRDYHHEKEQP